MTTETVVKGGVAVTFTAFSAFFCDLFVQALGLLILLVVFMLFDWITGIARAKKQKVLSSDIGFQGIVKKSCYFLVVMIAFGIDYLISFSAAKIGAPTFSSVFVVMLVTIWLIVNEGISILENIGELGVQYPPFVKRILSTLKNTVEKQVTISNDKEDKQ